MAVPYNFNQPYSPYPQQFPQQFQPNYKMEIIRVNGENGAKAYQLPPNSSILLLDETAPIIWLKTTDGASYPTIKGYTITPIDNEPKEQVSNSLDYSSLDERVTKLERMMQNGHSVKSNYTSNKQSTESRN